MKKLRFRARLVVKRCFQDEDLLAPGEAVNEIVGSVLARGQALHPVKLYGFIALPNQVRLIVDSHPDPHDYLEFVYEEIARQVSARLEREGPFWEHRARVKAIKSSKAAFRKLVDLYATPVKEDLVERAEDWHGFSTLRHSLGRE